MNRSLKVYGSSIFSKTALLGAVFLCLYLGLVLLWAPIYGHHLHSMAELILERAALLDRADLKPHPVLAFYQDLPFWDVYKAGALLAAMFFVPPIALALSVAEVLGRSRASCAWLWLCRALGLVGSAFLWGDFLLPFVWTKSQGLWVLLSYGLFVGLVLDGLIQRTSTKPQPQDEPKAKLNLWEKVARACCFLSLATLLLGILSSPVWDLWLRPSLLDYREKGEEAQLNRFTLIRDLCFLDERGENVLNSWYYGSSPYLMERERITSFQPMMVGVLGVNLELWERHFRHGFAGDRFGSVQPIAFIPVQEDDPLEHWLRRGVLDFVALGPPHHALKSSEPELENAMMLFDAQGSGEGLIHLGNVYRKVNGYHETPLTLRKQFLIKEMGLVPSLLPSFESGRRFFKGTLSNGTTLSAFAILLGLGLLAWTSVLWPFMERRILISGCCFLFCLTAFDWQDRLAYWTCSEKSVSGRIIEMHKIARSFDVKSVMPLLDSSSGNAILNVSSNSTPTPHSVWLEDRRLLMLSLSALGRNHQSLDRESQVQVRQKCEQLMERYQHEPLNLRYKLFDAFGALPSFRPMLQEALLKETHPYVWWYAGQQGFVPD